MPLDSINASFPSGSGRQLFWPLLAMAALAAGCAGVSRGPVSDAAPGGDPGNPEGTAVEDGGAITAGPDPLPDELEWQDLERLLTGDFDEISASAPEILEFADRYRVAADKIEVVRSRRSGEPVRAVAEGRVLVEMSLAEPVLAQAERAEIDLRQLVLKGSPILGRGDSVLAGLSDQAVFSLTGNVLRVSGDHEVLRREQIRERSAQRLASRGSIGGGSRVGSGERSYQIDGDFPLPSLPTATDQPDPVLLQPPPELPDFDDDNASEVPAIP